MVDANVTAEMINQIMLKYKLSFTAKSSKVASIPLAIDSTVDDGDGATLSDLTGSNTLHAARYSPTQFFEAPSELHADESFAPSAAGTTTEAPRIYADDFLLMANPPANAIVYMERTRAPEVVEAPSHMVQVEGNDAGTVTLLRAASETSQLMQPPSLAEIEQLVTAAQGQSEVSAMTPVDQCAVPATTLHHAFLVRYSFCVPHVESLYSFSNQVSSLKTSLFY